MTRARHLIPMPQNLVPRGMGHDQAAAYVGLSPSKFDELMKAGRMPQPRIAGGTRVWDIRALDKAFDALPEYGVTSSGDWKFAV